MTLLEHLAELRRRLVISVIAVTIGTLLAFFVYNNVIHFIDHPYRAFALKHPTKVIGQGQLVVTGPLEGFSTRLKVSAYLGIFLSSPVLFWELWRFITPGLHRHEKKYAISFVVSSVVLFTMGVTVSILVWPKALEFLINIGGNNIATLFGPQKYVNLYVAACAIFGIVFLFPVVLVFLEISGVVPSAKLRKWRRPAIVGIAFLATVATPSNDPYSFVAMAVPLYIFYEASIILGRILGK
ncbi:MAG: twin-arginine translocase subunit TatC [Actinomycetota bacterium]|nr:twin-arginine translocase subunit TatC [Actinomycetota bacterium]